MKRRVNVITLAVDDLERALVFYRDGLGLQTNGGGGRNRHLQAREWAH